MTDRRSRERFSALTPNLLSLLIDIGNGDSRGHHGRGITALLDRELIKKSALGGYQLSEHGMALYEALAGHQYPSADRYTLSHKVPSWVIVSAARYGLGRSTYITGMTHEIIRREFDNMHPVDQDVILEDMKQQFDLDELSRDKSGLRLDEERDELRELYYWCLERKKKE